MSVLLENICCQHTGEIPTSNSSLWFVHRQFCEVVNYVFHPFLTLASFRQNEVLESNKEREKQAVLHSICVVNTGLLGVFLISETLFLSSAHLILQSQITAQCSETRPVNPTPLLSIQGCLVLCHKTQKKFHHKWVRLNVLDLCLKNILIPRNRLWAKFLVLTFSEVSQRSLLTSRAIQIAWKALACIFSPFISFFLTPRLS